MPEPWKRHDLLRVEPRAWFRIISTRPQLAAVPHVAQWATRGWPLIVRRQLQDDDPELIPVGLPLPLANGKLRLAFQLSPDDVSARQRPLTLRAAREETPISWRGTVDAVLALADQTGVEPCVFGSLLWQRATGLLYLSASSDLDLLWPVADPDTADRLVGRLVGIAQSSPAHFDGEILLPDGGGVQWREWYLSSNEVLVKTSARVRLCAKRDVFSEGACPP